MPQMKPMNWIILFLFLNIMLIIMNILNYFFMLNLNYKKNKHMKNNKIFKWKW